MIEMRYGIYPQHSGTLIDAVDTREDVERDQQIQRAEDRCPSDPTPRELADQLLSGERLLAPEGGRKDDRARGRASPPVLAQPPQDRRRALAGHC